MKAANTAVFQRLVNYAASRDQPIPNPNAARWVHANVTADHVLKDAKVLRSMSFGRFRHLAWLEHEDAHYVGAIGFDHELRDPSLLVLDDVQGFDMCLLSESLVSPSASGAEVFNVVAAGSLDDGAIYRGHDQELVLALFPALRVYESVNPLSDDVVWSTFLGLCVEESRYGGSWIEERLADTLSALAQLNLSSMPYAELARSVLDLDPRSLFMSLYRCVEATYAHDKASKLRSALSIAHTWNEIAATLESEMAWRPLEAQSLNVVLGHAELIDLLEICDCLGVDAAGDAVGSTGTAIYRLRNKIVHYRPTHDHMDFENLDWNRLCNALAGIATDVFDKAYG